MSVGKAPMPLPVDHLLAGDAELVAEAPEAVGVHHLVALGLVGFVVVGMMSLLFAKSQWH